MCIRDRCTNGVMIPPPDKLTDTTAKCFSSSGIKFMLVRTYLASGKVDKNAVENIKTATAAGMGEVHALVYPAMYTEPKEQIADVLKTLKGLKIARLWININIPDWREFHQMNIETLRDLINGFQRGGHKVGILGTSKVWYDAFGSFTLRGDIPLIYESMNGKPDFKDFRRFGGWRSPYGKHYIAKSMCNVRAELLYRP
eukprot:TRINITY_DN5616_c0_g1_i19.p1 TRINITY_DN5616_c0_g1~~TRINITY_DN5616_c0_g1_i19.p1  ORF type:complete len:214 (-),score=50.61 TRINITY_DN5616_c0_g1_i19:106-702(-)